MIYLYSGTPGSGKSTHGAQTILDSVERKITVIANFEVNLEILGKYADYFHYVENYKLTPDFLRKFAEGVAGGRRVREGSILLMIDEAQLLFSPMEWQKLYAKGWLGFFTQHRKYGYDIVLITQVDRMIARQVRGLIEYEYIHRKVRNLGGFWGLFLSFLIGQFYVVETWYQVRNLKTGGHSMRYSKKAFQLFDTFKNWD